MKRSSNNAIVVGSGPNGLAAAITLQRAGVQVTLLERERTIGGGMRTKELTLPGFRHDVCSAIHPMALLCPFFQSLPLADFGLRFVHPPVLAAHPLDNEKAAAFLHSLDDTARTLGVDQERYQRLFERILSLWPSISENILGPPCIPSHPLKLARFGVEAALPAEILACRFKSSEAQALLAGMAAHSMRPLSAWATSAVALVLMTAGHLYGWPIAVGGSQSIADAMAAYFLSLGGMIETDHEVRTLQEFAECRAVLLDVAPRQLLALAGAELSPLYRRQLENFQYGPGAFKVDWALSEPIPFLAEECRRAGTVHIGGNFAEIARSEEQVNAGEIPSHPFVLVAQQSRFDETRAPSGKHTAWAYCHVPNGSAVDMTSAIEAQMERFAPGFRDCILARHTFNTSELQTYNPNYVGGDINGGAITLSQIYARPAMRFSPYRTSLDGVYLCSASTPPGGGVHGLCGYYAARRALLDRFPECKMRDSSS